MSNELVVIQTMGDVFVKSGFFADTRDQAQAVVKILAGQEMGISPIASMTGVYIVKGKPSMGANLIAACVKKSGKYNYRVTEHTEKVCKIKFFELEEGKFVETGESVFSIEDAKRAGTQNLDRFPRNMLFARAMSNGAKWYCADVFAGGVYTPDELGATVNYDDSGEIEHVVEAEVVEAKPAKKSEPVSHNTEETTSKATRPLMPETLVQMLANKANTYGSTEVNDKQVGLAASMIEVCFAGNKDADKIRHTVLKYLVGHASLKDCTGAQVKALLDWLKPTKDSGGEYLPNPMAAKEIQSVYTEALKAEGQEELPLG